MNFSKLVTTAAILALVGICAVNSSENHRMRQELRAMKNTLKRMKKHFSDMRESIEITKKSENDGFTTAFKMRVCEEEDKVIDVSEPFVEHSEFYIVREHNGVIGVFDDADELVRMIDRSITSFDAPDRQSLLLGVRAESDDELEQIVESFK